jgi:RNA polymerase sigma-70 factor (ECF subfamily)
MRAGTRRPDEDRKTGNHVDDTELLARIRAGDRAAERALYDAHVDRVYRLACRMTGDPALAQDLTQDAFIRAFQKLDSFRGESSLSTWLHTVTTSVVLNGLRKVKRFHRSEADLDEARRVAHQERRAEPDLKQRLTAAIDGLPTGYRTVFVMHDVEGYTHEEIARSLGVATGTSKAQLSRARARLRAELAEFAEEWVA